MSFFNADQNYHLFLLPVHYVPAETITEVSGMMEGDGDDSELKARLNSGSGSVEP